MFNFLFAWFAHNTKGPKEEYTPKMDAHAPIHDQSEGGEYLDDALREEDGPLLSKDDIADMS